MINNIMVDHTKNGNCSRCGKCCTDVLLLTNVEISIIKKFVKENNIVPNNPNTIFDTVQRNICPFLLKGNQCAIYNIRPKICQRFLCSEYCKTKNEDKEFYRGVEVISMLQTFYPFVKIKEPFDLSLQKEILKEKQQKIFGKGKNK